MSTHAETLEKGTLCQLLEKPKHRAWLRNRIRKHHDRWLFSFLCVTVLSLIAVMSCLLVKQHDKQSSFMSPTLVQGSPAGSAVGDRHPGSNQQFIHTPISNTESMHEKKLQEPLNSPSPSQRPHEPTSLVGPAIPFNFPDPAILSVNGTAYAFATNTRIAEEINIHIQVATSYDNLTWSLHSTHDALPNAGDWARSDGIWAPDVVLLPDQTFVMYYAAVARHKPGTHCIGAATSTTPLGPYTPLPEPITCPTHLGGAIDPDGFLDSSTGRRYISYKIDGNNIGHGGSCRNGIPPFIPTPLLLLEVNADDGVTPISSNTSASPIQLLDRIDIDGPLIEAPSLYLTSYGIYFLFYSSGCFSGETYDVKYATATYITGPWRRADTSLLSSGIKVGQCRRNKTDENDDNDCDQDSRAELLGPGGMDVLMKPYSYSYSHSNTFDTPSNENITANKTEETLALFHGILSSNQLPDGYDYDYESITTEHQVRHPPQEGIEPAAGWRDTLPLAKRESGSGSGSELRDGMPIKPEGVIRGMFQGRIRFEGRRAWFV